MKKYGTTSRVQGTILQTALVVEKTIKARVMYSSFSACCKLFNYISILSENDLYTYDTKRELCRTTLMHSRSLLHIKTDLLVLHLA
jgi:hypothetical protein